MQKDTHMRLVPPTSDRAQAPAAHLSGISQTPPLPTSDNMTTTQPVQTVQAHQGYSNGLGWDTHMRTTTTVNSTETDGKHTSRAACTGGSPLPSQDLDFSGAIGSCCCCRYTARRLLLEAPASAAAVAAAAAAADVAGAAAVCSVSRQQALVLRALGPAVHLTCTHDWEGVAEGSCLCVAQVPPQHTVLRGLVVRASLRNSTQRQQADRNGRSQPDGTLWVMTGTSSYGL